MKISCEKQDLLEAINAASKAVSAKSSLPALEGLLITAGDEIKISGYDLELGIEVGRLSFGCVEADRVPVGEGIAIDLPDKSVVLAVPRYCCLRLQDIVSCVVQDFSELADSGALIELDVVNSV